MLPILYALIIMTVHNGDSLTRLQGSNMLLLDCKHQHYICASSLHFWLSVNAQEQEGRPISKSITTNRPYREYLSSVLSCIVCMFDNAHTHIVTWSVDAQKVYHRSLELQNDITHGLLPWWWVTCQCLRTAFCASHAAPLLSCCYHLDHFRGKGLLHHFL